MEKEVVLAGVCVFIWLLQAGLIFAFNKVEDGFHEREVKWAVALLLGSASTAGCFALYLSFTLP